MSPTPSAPLAGWANTCHSHPCYHVSEYCFYQQPRNEDVRAKDEHEAAGDDAGIGEVDDVSQLPRNARTQVQRLPALNTDEPTVRFVARSAALL
jgi:hypothetical protein